MNFGFFLQMTSRKRKRTASRPQAQYDTRRFQSLEAWNRYTNNILNRRILLERNVKIYHTEFDEFKAELERRNLHKRLANLQDGSINVAVVKEFYAICKKNPKFTLDQNLFKFKNKK